jgi:hypothetical protein
MKKKPKSTEKKAIAEVSEILAQHLYELPRVEQTERLMAFKETLAHGRRDARASASKRGRISGNRGPARAEAKRA